MKESEIDINVILEQERARIIQGFIVLNDRIQADSSQRTITESCITADHTLAEAAKIVAAGDINKYLKRPLSSFMDESAITRIDFFKRKGDKTKNEK